MKMRDVGIVVLAASLAAAGLVYLHERPPDRPDAAQVAPQVTCLDPGMFPGHFPPPLPQSFTPPQPGTVPDDFDPVAVVKCDSLGGGTYFGPDGQNPAGTTVIVDEVRREGDLGELLGALSERSDPQAWGIEAWWGGKPGRGLTDPLHPRHDMSAAVAGRPRRACDPPVDSTRPFRQDEGRCPLCNRPPACRQPHRAPPRCPHHDRLILARRHLHAYSLRIQTPHRIPDLHATVNHQNRAI